MVGPRPLAPESYPNPSAVCLHLTLFKYLPQPTLPSRPLSSPSSALLTQTRSLWATRLRLTVSQLLWESQGQACISSLFRGRPDTENGMEQRLRKA